MPKHINSASRLHDIISNLKANAGGQPTYIVWAENFGINPHENHVTLMSVVERLAWMKIEFDAVRSGMQDKQFSTSLYEPQLSTIQDAMSPLQLGNDWSGPRQCITDAAMNSLAFCAEILPDEEAAISGDDRATILKLVTELETMLDSSEIQATLRELIRHHVALIYRALERYDINGVVAFREAAWTGLGELVMSADLLNGQSDVPEVSKLKNVWAKVNAVADAALKTDKIIQISQKITDLLS